MTHAPISIPTALSRRALLGSGLAAGVGAAFAPRLSFAATGPEWSAVNAMIGGYVDSGKLANMVAVLGRSQAAPSVIARGKLALASAARADADSLYRVYSMTKPLTGMTAMALIDEGKMGLDQPLADILPKFAKMQVLVDPKATLDQVRPAQTAITIRHLLTHTAGLGYSIIQTSGPIHDAYVSAGVIPGQISRIPIPGLERGKPVGSLAEFADRLAGLPLVYQPGTRWSYSVALDLMGRVIEVVTGKPFDQVMRERIIDPCGMTSTWFQVPASQEARLTTNYGVFKNMLVPIDPAKGSIYLDKPPFPFGGAGLVSSPRDYDRFLRMLLGYGTIDGRRVLSERAVRIGTGNLLPPGVDTAGTFVAGTGFGAGGRAGIGADEGTYGWGGAAGTVAFISRRANLRASLFTQFMPDSAYPVNADFRRAVLSDVLGTGTPAPTRTAA